MTAPPVVDRRIIETLLDDTLRRSTAQRLMLVHGRYDPTSPAEFTAQVGGTRRTIRVTDQPSVLGIVAAWQRHRDAADSGDLLVVTTGVDDDQLGWDLRGYAISRSALDVDRAEIVRQRFGAADLDARIRQQGWLVDALLAAEPPGGWPRTGGVLTRDTAIRALLSARLGPAVASDGVPDMHALLEWAGTADADRFAALPEAERDGIVSWLTDTAGEAAAVLLDLVAAGRGTDAVALGTVASVVTEPGASADAAVAVGGLLGAVRPGPLRAFTAAVSTSLDRWLGEIAARAEDDPRRHQVLDMLRRADRFAAEAGLTAAVAGNRYLESALNARLRALAATLSVTSGTPGPAALPAAEQALDDVLGHGLAPLAVTRCETATMGVRLLRWLATPAADVSSVAGGVRGHVADSGWVDRAIAVLDRGDPGGDAVLERAYDKLLRAARTRRDALDEAFGARLVAWAQRASSQAPGDCLLVEDLLAAVAVPLARAGAPLIVVLDSMSAAVAVMLGEQLEARGWIEVTPSEGLRLAAVSAIPSITRTSRTSLLCGRLTTGEQSAELTGFPAFWRTHHRPATLLHAAEIGGGPGQRLSERLVAELSGDGVVGVVLNTIDDALHHLPAGDRTGWGLTDIPFLPELLDAARDYGRPVLLVSDHGHVLDQRVAGSERAVPDGAESARWRTGTAGPGEVLLTGPRVLDGNGRVVAAWRADLRYRRQHLGYHGGASLAEMTVPVLALLPSTDGVPAGWSVLPPERTVPAWWRPRPAENTAHRQPRTAPPARRRSRRAPTEEGTLFAVPAEAPAAAPPAGLGMRAVATEVYQAQRAFVRKPPDPAVVAAVIDALAEAGGTLSMPAVAAAAGRAARNLDGLIATLQRLLNVEGYLVLSVIDAGRTLRLDTGLLTEQFGVEAR
jgi:hypothetical protein